MIYKICPGCGSHLDPGEQCSECQREAAVELRSGEPDEKEGASNGEIHCRRL